eukprot:SM000176S03122  [mRNA]  locus=s176:2094:4994:- [translate_table: standard]
MAISVETKLPILQSFHKHIYDPKWSFSCGEKDYRTLMDNFQTVIGSFLKLDEAYQNVIANITRRMGDGMAEFIVKEVITVKDYDLYCHYVAGLVGIGLSELFVVAKLEEPVSEALSESMGLFLQKTNIIRDYLEDINELPAPRMFWPRDIWGKYGESLDDFESAEPHVQRRAVHCLNELVTDALRHACDNLEYMGRISDQAIFRFCAIPQIMAIGTLAMCYQNAKVFQGVVKLRRGLSAKIMDRTRSMADVLAAFHDFAADINFKVQKDDPNAELTRKSVGKIQNICKGFGIDFSPSNRTLNGNTSAPAVLVLWCTLVLFLVYACSLPKRAAEDGSSTVLAADSILQGVAAILVGVMSAVAVVMVGLQAGKQAKNVTEM